MLSLAQSISIDVGSSNAKYIYKNSLGEEIKSLDSQPDFAFSLSTYFESKSNKKLSYKSSIRFQGMNSSGFKNNVPLTYQTDFLSLSFSLSYKIFAYYINDYCVNCSKVQLLVDAGFEAAKLISGTQTIGNIERYNLLQSSEFNGLMYGPTASLGLNLDITNYLQMILSYNQSYFFNSSQSSEQLNLNRSILSFGIKSDL